MIEILQGLLFCTIGALFFVCSLVGLSACMLSSRISREEELASKAYPAPEQKLLRH